MYNVIVQFLTYCINLLKQFKKYKHYTELHKVNFNKLIIQNGNRRFFHILHSRIDLIVLSNIIYYEESNYNVLLKLFSSVNIITDHYFLLSFPLKLIKKYAFYINDCYNINNSLFYIL